MPGKWDIPGGIVESGESVEEAILREVHEETGLTVRIVRVARIYSNRDQIPSRQTFQATYLCDYVAGHVNLNPVEHDDHCWLPYEQLTQIDAIDFLRDLAMSYQPAKTSRE